MTHNDDWRPDGLEVALVFTSFVFLFCLYLFVKGDLGDFLRDVGLLSSQPRSVKGGDPNLPRAPAGRSRGQC